MITLSVDYCNPISQKIYNDVITQLQFHRLTCSCGHSACLTSHGYYYRYIHSDTEKIRLRICRVKCSFCGRTHALLLSNIVPYSQISLPEHIDILLHHSHNESFTTFMNNSPSIDESNIRYLIKQYIIHWKQKLLSENIKLKSISLLVRQCFEKFSRQFMQIKSTPNILFGETT